MKQPLSLVLGRLEIVLDKEGCCLELNLSLPAGTVSLFVSPSVWSVYAGWLRFYDPPSVPSTVRIWMGAIGPACVCWVPENNVNLWFEETKP